MTPPAGGFLSSLAVPLSLLLAKKLRQLRGVAAPVEILNCELDTAIWRELEFLKANLKQVNRVSGAMRRVNMNQSTSLQVYFVRWIEMPDAFEYLFQTGIGWAKVELRLAIGTRVPKLFKSDDNQFREAGTQCLKSRFHRC